MKEERGTPTVTMKDLPSVDSEKTAPVIITNNNYNTDNSSVSNKTDVHSGALDTGIDTYHDKLATATT